MEAKALLCLLYVSLASSFLYTFFVSAKHQLRASSGNARRPPGPTPLPLVGNIFDLRGDPHRAFANLAATYGPVMSLKLGVTITVIASSAAAARDALHKYDHLLAARSITDAARALGNHEHSVIWLPSTSAVWKRLRAVCGNHLFSARGLGATQAVREAKVRELVDSIRGHAGQAVDVGRVVLSGMLNIVSNLLFSEDVAYLSSELAQELETLIKDTVEEVMKSNVSDLFPVLSALDLQGRRRRTGEYIKRFYDFFDGVIDRRLNSGGEKKEDFLDVLLQLHSADQLTRQTMRSFLADLFAAGTDTYSLTVEWTMAELLWNPSAMSKVRAELRDALGTKQYVDELDIVKLPYLQAAVKEAMRLHPPSPLLMPHEATGDDAEIGGFAVPKGARVIINLWAIMRDLALWAQPELFMPERFLERPEMDFRGKEFEFMPFGSGRRACLGMPLVRRMVVLTLASMLHSFDWSLPEGMKSCDVDITDWFGTALNLVTPLNAVPVPVPVMSSVAV